MVVKAGGWGGGGSLRTIDVAHFVRLQLIDAFIAGGTQLPKSYFGSAQQQQQQCLLGEQIGGSSWDGLRGAERGLTGGGGGATLAGFDAE